MYKLRAKCRETRPGQGQDQLLLKLYPPDQQISETGRGGEREKGKERRKKGGREGGRNEIIVCVIVCCACVCALVYVCA